MVTSHQRLVSLVPSITETLCTFGLQDRVVGCTSFCTHPLSLRRTAKAVGGTKDARLEDVLALEPTHVFVNVEENPPALVSALQEHAHRSGFVVHVSFPRELHEARELVADLARLLGFEEQERAWRVECDVALAALDSATLACASAPPRYAYFIWRAPWMVAGDKTYIARLLARAGLVNAFTTGDSPQERYPVVDPDAPPLTDPSLILLFSSEPFPFRQRHIAEFLRAAGQARRRDIRAQGTVGQALKIDGRLLSWYGSSTLPALRYLAELRERIHTP